MKGNAGVSHAAERGALEGINKGQAVGMETTIARLHRRVVV
jgi:hypothetical protein